MRDFNPNNIQVVEIDEVHPNEWNPKLKDAPEYQRVVESIRVNGLKSPIIVREVGDEYEICDGCQRWTAAKELGFEKIYIYNLGKVSDVEAKSITIWMEQQVSFDELALAPLIVELKELGVDLPYSDEEVEDFSNMLDFDFGEDNRLTLSVRCTPAQLENIERVVKDYARENGVDEAQALVAIVTLGGKEYE